MNNSRSRLKLLYDETRRRRLFRAVVVYLLVGLATLEGVSNLGSALNFPGWTDTFVAVLLLVGFPVVLLVGWFYDLTAAGFIRTEPVMSSSDPIRNETSDEPAPMAAGARSGQLPSKAPDRKSIAVLPFVDMSPDGDQEYFGDGIAEEIINALTRIDDLHVMARTSSFAFKTEY